MIFQVDGKKTSTDFIILGIFLYSLGGIRRNIEEQGNIRPRSTYIALSTVIAEMWYHPRGAV
ncbi:uncharacterized protein EDB91DRAFT_1332450 [Suillus paluster]|uniref:uncharacterized protein n=1 Tax=Suillus paluster TaxID=48578 RepID=UPI001B868F6D|nr:uncharacterized protein EDB91DRAFT_1332450 [Suillus paluster]KAG1756676.1 hypothetical protein EDB91DRAFT_1332450 [Suillus paluster]